MDEPQSQEDVPSSQEASSKSSNKKREKERKLLEDATIQAAEKMGIETDHANELYWGGVQLDIVMEEAPKVQKKEAKKIEVVREEIINRVPPTNQEYKIKLNHCYEGLGIQLRGTTITSLIAGLAASRAGLVPQSEIISIDQCDVGSESEIKEFLQSLRLAKRLDFTITTYHSIPPTAGLVNNYTAPSLRSLNITEPHWRSRLDSNTYESPKHRDITLQDMFLKARINIDSKKKNIRIPKGMESADLDDPHVKDVIEFQRTEESKRTNLIRWYRGDIARMREHAPDNMKNVVSDVYQELMERSLVSDADWVVKEVWKTADDDVNNKSATSLLTDSKRITAVDWIDPVFKTIRPPGSSNLPNIQSPYSRNSVRGVGFGNPTTVRTPPSPSFSPSPLSSQQYSSPSPIQQHPPPNTFSPTPVSYFRIR